MTMIRDSIIKIRVTSAGKQRWSVAAGAAGVELSEWIRAACRSYMRGGDDAAVRAELVRLRTELSRLGSNLNQVQHAINTRQLSADAVASPLAAIAAMRAAITAALERS